MPNLMAHLVRREKQLNVCVPAALLTRVLCLAMHRPLSCNRLVKRKARGALLGHIYQTGQANDVGRSDFAPAQPPSHRNGTANPGWCPGAQPRNGDSALQQSVDVRLPFGSWAPVAQTPGMRAKLRALVSACVFEKVFEH